MFDRRSRFGKPSRNVFIHEGQNLSPISALVDALVNPKFSILTFWHDAFPSTETLFRSINHPKNEAIFSYHAGLRNRLQSESISVLCLI